MVKNSQPDMIDMFKSSTIKQGSDAGFVSKTSKRGLAVLRLEHGVAVCFKTLPD